MIYFVQAGTDGPIKIGHAKDVAVRIANIQSSAHEQLIVLTVMDGGVTDEKILHRRFVRHNIRGEWFAPDEELTAFIRSLPVVAVRRTKEQKMKRWFAEIVASDGASMQIDRNGGLAPILEALTTGCALKVERFSRLAWTRDEARAIFAALRPHGAVLLETATRRRSDNADDVFEMMAETIAEIAGDADTINDGKVFGENAAQRRTPEVEAKSVWYDPNGGSVADRLARPQMRGWTKMTAFRRLGKTK